MVSSHRICVLALIASATFAVSARADTDLFFVDDPYARSCPGLHGTGRWSGVVTVGDDTLTFASEEAGVPIVLDYHTLPKPWCFKKSSSCMSKPQNFSVLKAFGGAENADLTVNSPDLGESSTVTFSGTVKLDDDGNPKKLSGTLTGIDATGGCAEQLFVEAKVD